jgi:hypothetical protein
MRCLFETILKDYAVADPALQKLALILSAADVKGQESAAPERIGLRSIAQGFAALGISDARSSMIQLDGFDLRCIERNHRLVRQFPIYDGLYAYVGGK